MSSKHYYFWDLNYPGVYYHAPTAAARRRCLATVRDEGGSPVTESSPPKLRFEDGIEWGLRAAPEWWYEG
jgi:hypothetical protein